MGRKNKKRQAKRAEDRRRAKLASRNPTKASRPSQVEVDDEDGNTNNLSGLLENGSSIARQRSNVCHHGAAPPSEEQRKTFQDLLNYCDDLKENHGKGISPSIVLIRFLRRNRDSLGPEHATLAISMAADIALEENYDSARLLAHFHLVLDKWLEAGKPPIPFPVFREANSVEEALKSFCIPINSIWHEIEIAKRTVHIPGEVCNYIHKHIPCDCLRQTKKAANKIATKTTCTGCGKEGSHKDFKLCSGCKAVEYCSRECQLAHWPNHKPFCKVRQGKQLSVQEITQMSHVVHEGIDGFLESWSTLKDFYTG